MDEIASAVTDALRARAALVGITTPLGSNLPIGSTGSVLAVITARLGTLAVDPAPGATVRGNGTAMLWVSGTAAQVSAKLETLGYTGTAVGTDTLSVTFIDAAGHSTVAAQIPIAVVPLASEGVSTSKVIEIDRGTVVLDTRVINGPALAFSAAPDGLVATTGILVNTTIGARSTLTVRNNNAVGSVAPRLAVAGRVELDGSATLTGNGTAVLIAQGASLVNEGTMTIGRQAAQFSGAGMLVNDGSITIDGSLGEVTGSGAVRFDVAIAGNGRIALAAGAAATLNGSIGPAETVDLGAGDNILHLARPSAFAGLITGFSAGDTIVLDGVSATSASVRVGAETGHSSLLFLDGDAAIGTIRFGSLDAGTVFQLGADAAGNTTVRLATVTSVAPSSTTTDVFRFFDAAHGTQLLTQDRTERGAILASRPDLKYEGVAFQSVEANQADPATAPVFRFFDTRNGTHFMTANAGERDFLVANRADLVFEPGSTMFEHSTARADDVAVYRYFDRDSGAHFFTADATERAQISASRPDMTLEGIAFYAPAR